MSKQDHTKLYLAVFGGLIVLTIATVGVSYIHIPQPWGLIVGLAIAAAKASLVCAFFMHLKWEKALIFAFLGLTVAAAAVLFALPLVDVAWTEDVRVEQPVVIPGHDGGHEAAHDDHGHDHGHAH